MYKTPMTLERAVDRLSWRFTNSKQFIINFEDIEALNTIFAFINETNQKTLDTNHLVSKLLMIQLHQSMEYFKASLIDEFLLKDIQLKLSKPLDFYYTAFKNSLYSNQLKSLSKENTNEQNNEIISSMQLFKEVFNDDVIKSKVNSLIVEVINKYSKLK